MRKYYAGITLFKLGGCLLVVAAHVMLMRYMALVPGQAFVQFSSLAMRIVVPCFYVISGFLAFKGWSRAVNPQAYVRKYAARILIVYVLFILLFASESIVPRLIGGGMGISNLILQAKVLAVAFFLNGPFVQFWFIPPLLFGIAASYWLIQREYDRFAAVSALACFAGVQLVSGSLMDLGLVSPERLSGLDPGYAEYLVSFVTRYFGFGFVFVTAGALAAKYEDQFMRLEWKKILAGALLLTAAEIMLLYRLSEWTTDYKLTLSVLPNTFLLFYGLLRIKSETVRTCHRVIGIFSAVTFFGHILFMKINLWLLGWNSLGLTIVQDFVYLLLTLAECAAVTLLIVSLRGKEGRRFSAGRTENASS